MTNMDEVYQAIHDLEPAVIGLEGLGRVLAGLAELAQASEQPLDSRLLAALAEQTGAIADQGRVRFGIAQNVATAANRTAQHSR
ncbi:hypothetical protein SAMN05216241_11241 [Limimonas halophila]|uniref:Uncharacterized protein n=1 Tax=Limimonas halophila TaxID=1082479 RepID=A0A1G7U7C4_9PROT|nr:hypothetical protein [Limimonas halophila]SDG43278.1 hypothetical protein SAMN05216241_11241 [Limimonas halophila]